MKARLALAVAALLATSCGGEAGREPAEPPSAASKRVGSSGVTVELPPGWHTTNWHDGSIGEPATRVVVASAPVAPKPTACQLAHYEFATDAIALVVLEWREPDVALRPRPARFTAAELPVQPPPAAECFDGPAGTAHFADRGHAFGAYLLVGRDAPEGLIEEARRVLDTLRVERPGELVPRKLVRNGISMTVPAGWFGRVLFREPTGRDRVIFQIANIRLPPNAGFEPSGELPPYEQDTIKAMAASDVLVTISDGAAGGAPAPTPLTLGDLAPVHGPRVPSGHTFAAGSFCFDARCVQVEVDFGGAEAPSEAVQGVDDVLSSLRIGRQR